MVEITRIERKSTVLKPSSLACLSHIPTINLTSGCAHGCLYCYARGYSIHPGGDNVVIYRNTLEKIKAELAHKRSKPVAVYFSPSSDIFQPVPEVLELGHSILEYLLTKDIGVAFVSKGPIPEKTMNLLLSHAEKVRAQIGIVTLDENIQRIFEPNTASPKVRIEQIAKLVAGGIATEARIIPVLPGCTDDPDSLDHLFHTISGVGVKRAAISALFLRPAIIASLKRGVSHQGMLKSLLDCYRGSKRIAVHAENSSVVALPRDKREALYARIRRVAKEYCIELSVCTCMNPDIATGTCNITGSWHRQDNQPSLFDKEG